MDMWRRVWLLASVTLLGAAGLTPDLQAARTAANDGTLIAYVSPSRENQQIRVVNPDGSGDRALWSVSQPVPRDSGIGTLSWRSDATELAFSSSHDAARSTLTSDIYSVTAGGTRLRRITGPPGPSEGGAGPRGTVTVAIENYTLGRDLIVYVDGATNAERFTAPANTTWEVTFTDVADLGPDVRQYAHVLVQGPSPVRSLCWDDPGAYADVQPGQTVSAGKLSNYPQELACTYAFAPTWNGDGSKLSYLLQQGFDFSQTSITNVWQTSAAPATGTLGDLKLDMGQFVARGRLYALAHAPTAALAGQILYAEVELERTVVYRAAIDDAANATRIDLTGCGRVTCAVAGLAWLPDGSGFVFSRIERGGAIANPRPEGSAIYVYTFASGTASEILRTSASDAIGQLSVSPDGQQIVFERATQLDATTDRVILGPRLLCPCGLWVVGRNGGPPRQLVADGRAPAWSPAAPRELPIPPTPIPPPPIPPPPGASLQPRAWLPLVRR